LQINHHNYTRMLDLILNNNIPLAKRLLGGDFEKFVKSNIVDICIRGFKVVDRVTSDEYFVNFFFPNKHQIWIECNKELDEIHVYHGTQLANKTTSFFFQEDKFKDFRNFVSELVIKALLCSN